MEEQAELTKLRATKVDGVTHMLLREQETSSDKSRE